MLNNLRKLQVDDSEKQIETFYILMREFGWTIEELKKLPIPTMQFLIKMINKKNERESKSMKSIGRKR